MYKFGTSKDLIGIILYLACDKASNFVSGINTKPYRWNFLSIYWCIRSNKFRIKNNIKNKEILCI